MKKQAIVDPVFSEGDTITITDKNNPYVNKVGIIARLGSAGDNVIYLHTQLIGVNTIIAFRTFQVQKGG